MRQRLSWGKEADMSKKADPYTMNQDHKNNPVQKYDVGGPAEFAETPDTKTPWKSEGRNEVGLPAPERAAVQAARKLEDKALKCITIAQRILPGATDEMIEKQATDLMYMPDRAIIATLQRQAEFAEMLASKCKDEEDDDSSDADAAKTDYPEEKKPEMKEEKEAAKEEAPKEEEKKEEPKEEEKKEEEVVEAAKEEAPKEEEKKEEPKEEKEEEGEDVEASTDLLDQIFAESTPKVGAKKLSGIVKQASSESISLDNLWNAPPDVSKAFR